MKQSFDPFCGEQIETFFALTEAQTEVWLASKMDDIANLAYNEGIQIRYSGEINEVAFEKACRTLFSRHQSLRSTISPDGKWMCVLANATALKNFGPVNLDHSGDTQSQLKVIENSQMEKPFDLENGPLSRISWIRISDTEHLIYFTAHHIVCDGWSVPVMLNELGRLYSEFSGGDAAKLATALKYSDYSDIELRFIKSETGLAHQKYWLDQLANPPEPLDLPTAFKRPPQRDFLADRLDYPIDSSLTASLRKAGAKSGASLVATVLAGFAAYVHRISGSSDLVLGLAAAGQSLHDQRTLVGHCVNLLPVRLKPQQQQPFSDFLVQTRSAVLDAYDHQGVTFGQLLPQLNIERDPARPPLIPIMFNIDVRDDDIEHRGLQLEYKTLVRRAENFELFINVVDYGDSLLLECSYNTALFDKSFISQRLGELEMLLRDICADSGKPINQLQLISDTRKGELSKLNPPATEWPKENTLECLLQNFELHPAQIATRDTAQETTYEELRNLAFGLAHQLTEANLKPGEFVAVCIERNSLVPAPFIAAWLAGAAYLPIDPDLPEERIRFMLKDTEAKAVILSASLNARLGGVFDPIEHKIIVDECEPKTTCATPALSGESPAYIIYTSGSTGNPKGVLVSHGNLINFLRSMKETLNFTGQNFLAVTTLSFDIAAMEVFLPLVAGGTLFVATREQAANPDELSEIIRNSDISIMQATPATWRMLLEANWAPPTQTFIACCGGEPLKPDLAQGLISRVQTLWNLYGPTETTIWSSAAKIEDPSRITVGKPLANTRFYVLDENLNILNTGLAGELWIAGAGVALEYWNRPELTAMQFSPDPFCDDGSRMYRTGDKARWQDNGELQHLGRLDYQVKVRGYRIELGEIEVIANSLEGLSESVATISESADGDARLVLYFSGTASIAELRKHVRAHLPGYMVPQFVQKLAEIPKLGNGKIDRKSLPKINSVSNTNAEGTSLSTPQEKALATLWQQHCGLPVSKKEQRFFDLGGHSLLAVRVAAEIRRRTGQSLPLRALMMDPLGELAQTLPKDFVDATNAAVDEHPKSIQMSANTNEDGGMIGLESPLKYDNRENRSLWQRLKTGVLKINSNDRTS